MAASSPFLGQIQAFAFDYAPRGWVQCTGQLLTIQQNQALFALVGTYYGGDAKVNFGIPDLRGRTPRGFGQGTNLSVCTMGQKNGAETITLTLTNLPAHTHTLVTNTPYSGPKASTATGDSPSATSAYNVLGALNDPQLSAINNFYNNEQPDTYLNTGSGNTPSLAVSGSSTPIPLMQPFTVVNFCIATTGVFPSRN